MSLALAVEKLRPAARNGIDFIVRDDGKGPYIAKWDTGVLGVQPSSVVLTQAIADVEADRLAAENREKQDRLLLRQFKDLADPTGAQIVAAIRAIIRLNRAD